ncbi:hypothetical protein ACFX2F_022351 [Malus domestica]
MGVDWQGGEGRGRSKACQKECWIDFSTSNQGLVSRLRSGSKMGMVVREKGMAETEVMELGVGIPQIKGCYQWVLISAMSMIGILKPLKRSLDLFSPPMANSLIPTPRVKRLCMSHKEFNPWLAKNHLAGLSLVHWEVVLNDLLMPLPSQSIWAFYIATVTCLSYFVGCNIMCIMKILRKRRWEELKTLWLLVYLHQGQLRKDDESTRSPEGRVNSPMTVRVSKFVKEIVLALAIKGISRLFPHTDVKPAIQEQDLISHA